MASLALYLFSSTRLIHLIKHDHSCKILYVCFLFYQTVLSYTDSMKLRSAAMLKTMRNALLREQVDQKRNLPVVKKKLGQVSQQSKKKKIASRKAAKNARRYVKPVLSGHSKKRLNLFLRPIIA